MFLKSISQAYLKLEIKEQVKHKANSRPEQILVHKWNKVQENHRRQKQVAGLAKDRKDTNYQTVVNRDHHFCSYSDKGTGLLQTIVCQQVQHPRLNGHTPRKNQSVETDSKENQNEKPPKGNEKGVRNSEKTFNRRLSQWWCPTEQCMTGQLH